jgi:putative effector of murein hydrolase
MDQFKAMSRSSQLLLGAGILLFIFLFFDWQQASAGGFTVGRSGWHGWGTAAGIFLIILMVWEAALLLGVKIPELPVKPVMLSTVVAALVLLFTVIKFLVDNEFRHWPAWIGLILAIVIGIGGFLRWSGDAVKVWQRPATPPTA